jgi:glutamate 5-kinase
MSTVSEVLQNSRKIVIKIGSNVISDDSGNVHKETLHNIVEQAYALIKDRRQVVIVSSGAGICGVGAINKWQRRGDMNYKQALCAIGQVELMMAYRDFFADYDMHVAQILLTKDGIDDPITRSNISNTMESLLEKGILPVVNENDTVSTAEIPHAGTFGDNDTLSALVARVVNADLLIILSDIDAVYDSNPRENPDAKRISVVTEVDDALISGAGGAGSALGTGGMQTKILAMNMLMQHGIAGVIAEGSQSQILEDILEGEDIGTLFVPTAGK